MSTNKSEHYGLHLWESGDDFLRSEFNENFAALDGAAAAALALAAEKCQVVTGAYRGDDLGSQVITLGFRPKLVAVCTTKGTMTNGGVIYGGVFLDTPEATEHVPCTITENGFTVRSEGTTHMDDSYYTYRYLALKG